jgi:Domain of unknown function (DUF4336)
LGALLSEFGAKIWIAEGPVVRFWAGFPYPTRMAAIRLDDGDLFIWSPVALTPELKRAVDALGHVRHLVSPNLLHHLFLKEWKAAYPASRLYAPPGLAKRRKDIAFDAELGDQPEPAWQAEIDQVAMRGSVAMTEIVFFHRASATAIFADLVQNLPRDWIGGWRGLAMRLDGVTAPNPGAPREWRLSFIHRRAARAAIDRILAWPVERVLIAHGEPQRSDGAAFVRRAFSWLIARRA